MRAEFTYSPIFSDDSLRAEVVARIDGQPIARQRINLSSDISRKRFRKAVLAGDDSAKTDDVDAELLRISEVPWLPISSVAGRQSAVATGTDGPVSDDSCERATHAQRAERSNLRKGARECVDTFRWGHTWGIVASG